VERSQLSRDSAEYVEIIAEVFVETVRKAAVDAMCSEYGKEDITPALMECLQYLYLHGPSSIRDIACGLEVTLSAASQLVDRLVKKGLASRRENENDRRLAMVEISEAGADRVSRMRERRYKWFESMINAMPESKRRSFLDGLESFLKVALTAEKNIDRACVRCGIQHMPFCVINKLKRERAEEGAVK
jgi:DNA-binding MarR family transcriptional regulator